MLDEISLGAALYVPAIRKDVGDICAGQKLKSVRTIILCTEDAVRDSEVEFACENIRRALALAGPDVRQNLYVRVRSPEVLRLVLSMRGVDGLSGFVLPKVTRRVVDDYFRQLHGTEFLAMPTLETREVFDRTEMFEMVRHLDRDSVRSRIPVIRIGGNDLLSLIGMRRPVGRTIYETPIGQVISSLVTTFCPYGFSLSAPVFEYLNDFSTLAREVDEDLAHGLVGKTAIHPDQVPHIEYLYKVTAKDVDVAQMILAKEAPAVFNFHEAMCEPATHSVWARRVLDAAEHFGLKDDSLTV